MTPEEKKAWNAAYYQAHKEANKKASTARSAAWAVANKEKLKDYRRQWYSRHQETVRTRSADRYWALSPEERKDANHATWLKYGKPSKNAYWATRPGEQRAQSAVYVTRLSDGYIAAVMGVSVKALPKELIELKRVHLLIKRELKK